MVLCQDDVIAVALATSLRLLNQWANQSEGNDARTLLIGHTTRSVSLDKTVQMVAEQRQSELWQEFAKRKFNVMITTFDTLMAVDKRKFSRIHVCFFESPQTVSQLALLLRFVTPSS